MANLKVRQGNSVSWRIFPDPERMPPEWSANFTLGGNGEFLQSSAAELVGGYWTMTLTAAQTAQLQAGLYLLECNLTAGAVNSHYASRRIEVLNPSSDISQVAPDKLDQALERIDEILAGGNIGQAALSIDGQSITFRTIAELQSHRRWVVDQIRKRDHGPTPDYIRFNTGRRSKYA